MSEEKNCLFCRIASGEIPSKKVKETDEIYAFEDINPQAPVHILIIPRIHISTVNDLHESDVELIGRLVIEAKKIAMERGISEDGYRLVVNCNEGAGQAVFHIHLHLLGGREMTWPPG